MPLHAVFLQLNAKNNACFLVSYILDHKMIQAQAYFSDVSVGRLGILHQPEVDIFMHTSDPGAEMCCILVLKWSKSAMLVLHPGFSEGETLGPNLSFLRTFLLLRSTKQQHHRLPPSNSHQCFQWTVASLQT